MKTFFKAILYTFLVCLICGVMATACDDAIKRESEMRDQQRLDRCAHYGENLPRELRAYCKGGQ